MTQEFRALIVDDEAAVRDLTSRALSRRGFVCSVAQDGREALDLLAQQARFDVVISDFRMPNLNGHRLVMDVCRLPDRPVVILVTGVIDPALVGSVLNSGADDILFKPIDYDVLAVKVRHLVETRERESQYANSTIQ
ncbi:MAG: response regulator [Pirellulaceae bacterium]|jgi:DNA-binding response OmpR family regulator|nr:response regulator [Pirellulaceae bacterium]MDP7016284.1 response regulator [Pirellulaceae bacterium]